MHLEHNVHESLHLLNSDSLDDMADESPERSILRHSGHQSPATGHTGTSHTGHTGTGHTGHTSTGFSGIGHTVTGQIVSIQSADHIRLGLMLLITGQLC